MSKTDKNTQKSDFKKRMAQKQKESNDLVEKIEHLDEETQKSETIKFIEQVTKEMVLEYKELNPVLKTKFIELIQHGASRREACRALNLPFHQLNDYLGGDADFRHSLLNAFEDSIGWYDEQARLNFTNRNFNTALYMTMRENQSKEKWQLKKIHEKDLIIEDYLKKMLNDYVMGELESDIVLERLHIIKNFQNCLTIEELQRRIQQLETLAKSDKN